MHMNSPRGPVPYDYSYTVTTQIQLCVCAQHVQCIGQAGLIFRARGLGDDPQGAV